MASNILKHLAATSGGNVNQLTNATSSESEDLMDIQERAVAGLLSCFGDMVSLGTESIGEETTIEQAALRSLKMESKTQEIIKHVEDLLKLTRRIRELWVIGPLRPADGIDGESEISEKDKELISDIEKFEQLTNQVQQQRYANLVASMGVGTYQVVDKLDDDPDNPSGQDVK